MGMEIKSKQPGKSEGNDRGLLLNVVRTIRSTLSRLLKRAAKRSKPLGPYAPKWPDRRPAKLTAGAKHEAGILSQACIFNLCRIFI
jgi:hypothetical protein